jgi:hypothetical protein
MAKRTVQKPQTAKSSKPNTSRSLPQRGRVRVKGK